MGLFQPMERMEITMFAIIVLVSVVEEAVEVFTLSPPILPAQD